MKNLTPQQLNVFAIVAALCALVGTLFPLAEGERFWFAVRHLDGAFDILFVFPVIAIVVAIMALYGRLRGVEWWYLSIAALGSLMSVAAILVAAGRVNTWEGQLGDFSLGGLWLLLTYAVVGAVGVIIKLRAAPSRPGTAVEVRLAPEIGQNIFPALNPEFMQPQPLESAVAPAFDEPVSVPPPARPVKDAVPSTPRPPVVTLNIEDSLTFTDKSYYWERWQPLINQSSYFGGFNLSACIFGVAWCFYRKCYLLGVMVMAAEAVIAFVAGIMLGIFFRLVFDEEPSKAAISLIPTISAIVLSRIPLAFWANRALYDRARKVVRRVNQLNLDQEERREAIRSRGGVSVPGLIAVYALNVALFIVSR